MNDDRSARPGLPPESVRQDADGRDVVVLGHITGAHGIKGWIKLHSDTDPREEIFNHQPWLLGSGLRLTEVKQGRRQGKLLVAELSGVSDRDAAESLQGTQIAVYRDQLPELPDSQYYWADLIGLKVYNEDDVLLGTVKAMMATGANDVMVVAGDRERLVPFVPGQYVNRVDLDRGSVQVNWDPDF